MQTLKNILTGLFALTLAMPLLAQPEFKRLSAKERIAIAEREEVEAATDAMFMNYMDEGHNLFQQKHYLRAIRAYESAQQRRPYNVYPRVIIADIELSMRDTLAVLRRAEQEAEAEKRPEPSAPIKTDWPDDDPNKRIDDWEKRERERRERQREAPKPEPEIRVQQGDVPTLSVEDLRKELGAKYPTGVTERTYKEGNRTITERIVVRDGRGDEYRKVVHAWGGKFYFKNGEAIPERVWVQETER